jgi:hypothetical protein
MLNSFFFMQTNLKNILKIVGKTVVIIFAIIGFLLTSVYFAVRFGLTNTDGIIDTQRQEFLSGGNSQQNSSGQNLSWQTTPEWQTLKSAVLKDQNAINKASSVSGVPARLIVENLIAEQLRFFYDDRESYKKFFEPLKILGSETQFSWGVMGVKEETAVQIEKNLTDKSSAFYLGDSYSHLLDFKTADIQQERFARMTDQHDHYYSYLYAGLYLKQIEQQWKNAGFDISTKENLRPEILATLYNVGFKNSLPNPNPKSGGAGIPIGTGTMSFGSLAKSFYDSNELINEFPR